MDIDVLRPSELTPAMMRRWAELQRLDPSTRSPFFSPCWSRSVEAARGGGLKVAVLSEAGEARGFLAATAGRITAIAPGGVMCDYEGLVAEPGLAIDLPAVARALGVSRLDFRNAPAGQASFAPHARGASVSWIIDTPDGYDAYAAERRAAGASALKDLDKKRRRALRDTGEIVFTPWSAERAHFERLIELKRIQYRETGQTDVFDAGWPLRLLEQLHALKAPGFGGALFTLHMGGKLAAVHFHLMGETVIHAWLIAHEPEFERHSPGLLLFQDILRWMDGQPYRRLDLGYGDYRFKRELSNTQLEVMEGFVGRPSAATLARGAAYSLRRTLEALPLGAARELPGKAMRRLDLLRGLR